MRAQVRGARSGNSKRIVMALLCAHGAFETYWNAMLDRGVIKHRSRREHLAFHTGTRAVNRRSNYNVS